MIKKNATKSEILLSNHFYIQNRNKIAETGIIDLGDEYLSSQIGMFRNILSQSMSDWILNNSIFQCKTTLVHANQGVGKSTLVGILGDELACADVYTILVLPTVTNLLHMKKHGFFTVAGKNTVKDGGIDSDDYNEKHVMHRKIAVTPDSLYKVLKTINSLNLNFVVHIDETHHQGVSVCFRKVYRDLKSISENNKNCIHVIGYTATLGPLLHMFEYDNILTFKSKREIIDKPLTTYVMKDFSGRNKARLIKEMFMEHIDTEKDEPMLVYLSDKQQHEEVLKNLNGVSDIFNIFVDGDNVNSYISDTNGKTIKISADTKMDENISQIITSGVIPKECKLILVTSIVSCGVEFFMENATILTFCTEKAFNFVNEIQFSRRNRKKIKKLIIAVPDMRSKWEILSYETYRSIELKRMYKALEVTVEQYKYLRKNPLCNMITQPVKDSIMGSSKFRFLDRYRNADGECSNEIDMMYYQALDYIEEEDKLEICYDTAENIAWDSYVWNMLKNPAEFTRIYMQECTHFKFTKEPEIIYWEEKAPTPDNNNTKSKDEKDADEKNKKRKNEIFDILKNDYEIEDVSNAISESLKITESSKPLYAFIKELERVDSKKMKKLKERLQELDNIKYKVRLTEAYLDGKALKVIYDNSKGLEEKQIAISEVVKDYMTKDEFGRFLYRKDLDLQPKQTLIHFVNITMKYFTNDRGTVKNEMKIRVSSEYDSEFYNYYLYLCENKYYKESLSNKDLKKETKAMREERQKKEFSERFAVLKELVGMMFNLKASTNAISSVKK